MAERLQSLVEVRHLTILVFSVLLIPSTTSAGVCQWLLSTFKQSFVLNELPEFHTPEDVQIFIDKHPYRFDLFPRIDISELGPLKSMRNDGMVNAGIYRSTLAGKEVIVKRSSSPVNSIGDVAWLYFLNQYGLGVRLHGIVKVERRWAIVIDYVPGVNSKKLGLRNLGLLQRHRRVEITETAAASMRDQLIQLHEMGIDADDWQFMVNGDNAVLIDVAFFRYEYLLDPAILQKRLAILEEHFQYWRDLGLLVQGDGTAKTNFRRAVIGY